MPSADIKIVREGDPVPWPDLPQSAGLVHTTDPWQIAILEHGMSSGKPSVALRFDFEDGTTLISETSFAMLIAIMATARGAFPEEFVGGPFEER